MTNKKTKVCNRCKTKKRLEEYHNTKNGHSGICAKCINLQIKQYRENNKDVVREQRKQTYEKNKHKHKERIKLYRESNKTTLKTTSQKWYQKNRKSVLERNTKNNMIAKERREDNPEELEKYRSHRNELKGQRREKLADGYIKATLTRQ